MKKKTKLQQNLETLQAAGWVEDNNTKVVKYLVLSKPGKDFHYYLGRAGACRRGKTVSGSIPVTLKHKEIADPRPDVAGTPGMEGVDKADPTTGQKTTQKPSSEPATPSSQQTSLTIESDSGGFENWYVKDSNGMAIAGPYRTKARAKEQLAAEVKKLSKWGKLLSSAGGTISYACCENPGCKLCSGSGVFYPPAYQEEQNGCPKCGNKSYSCSPAVDRSHDLMTCNAGGAPGGGGCGGGGCGYKWVEPFAAMPAEQPSPKACKKCGSSLTPWSMQSSSGLCDPCERADRQRCPEDKQGQTEQLWCEGTEPDCCESAPGDEECIGCGRPVKEDKQGSDPTPAASASTPPSSLASAAVLPAGLAAKLRERAIDGAADQAGCPHVIVIARAGTGKTTTLVEGLKVVKGLPTSITPSPQQAAVWEQLKLSQDKAKSICFVAFNKSIATELQQRVPAGCDAMTMHSMGFRAVTRMFGRQEPTDGAVQDTIADLLNKDIWWLRSNKPVLLKATAELVGLCKQNLVGLEVYGKGGSGKDAHTAIESTLDELASRHDIDLNGSKEEVFELVPKVLEACKRPKGKISYDDMIWLPVVLNLPVFRYDLLLCDEWQDSNRCMQALARKAGKRLVMCGDDRQAIYGFAGADSESLHRMEEELGQTTQGVVVLPLTVTRRCGKAIVAEAQRYVPDFEAHESNGEGKISRMNYGPTNPGAYGIGNMDYHAVIEDGDFVLCRCNAPLVSQCFKFLRAGRKANIQGRDIAKGLVSTLEKMKATGVVDLVHKLGGWLHKEQAKENAKRFPSETRLEALQDRHDCLVCFTEGAETVAAVKQKIESIFTDDKKSPGIKLSSIHRAKGLEARRVFILLGYGKRTFGPPPDKLQAWERGQEDNLRYVAITRAIEELVWVS